MTGRDLAIVGGGPAGLALALEAARLGLTALVIEPGEPGRDKACGEGILPDGVAALEEMGVEAAALGRPFRGIAFADASRAVAADFPGRRGLAVRRSRLHRALADAAARAGADLRWRERVVALTERGVRLASGETIEARFVVGADGLHSRVRRWAGLDRGAGSHRRYGVRRHYRVRPWSERIEVHWRDGCEAYLTPVGEEELGVAMLWSGGPSRFDRLLGRFPELAARLSGCEVLSRDRGAGPLHQRSRAVIRGRVALLGDAAGYLDALTGEGLALAFREAQALARSAARGGLEEYARASRRLRRLPETLTRLLLVIERRPRLRRRFFRALERDPGLFARLLAVHCRAVPPYRVGWQAAARLAGVLAGV